MVKKIYGLHYLGTSRSVMVNKQDKQIIVYEFDYH